MLKILRSAAIAAIPFVLEVLFYLPSSAFRDGVFGFGAIGYLFTASIDLTFTSISIFQYFCSWLGNPLCGFLFLEPQNHVEEFKWFTFLGMVLVFLLFGLSSWHSQFKLGDDGWKYYQDTMMIFI